MKKQTIKGFTLIELAVVLTIVAMVIGGLSIPIGKHFVEKQYADTQANIDKAMEAIVGFAIQNRRLPCPDIATATSDNRDGIEDVDVNTTSGLIDGCSAKGVNTGAFNYTNSSDASGASWGDLPWQTLGLSAPNNSDAWSHRLRYAVFTPLVIQTPPTLLPFTCLGAPSPVVGFANLNPSCTSVTTDTITQSMLDIRCGNPTTTTAATAAPGCKSIASPAANGTPTFSVSTNAVFVVYSMGANGWGSTNINSVTTSMPFTAAVTVSIPDQAQNAPELTSGTTTCTTATCIASRKQYVARPRTDATSAAGEFDDVVSFMSANALVARLVNAGVYP